jgi:amine acid ABC transporter, permease protein, 3-TM region, His/Glu/Gln/Arg/opine family
MPNLFDFRIVLQQIPQLLRYLPVTLELTVVSMLFGLVLGLVLAIIQINKIPVLNQIAALYISVLRGTPIIVQLYISYFGIPIFLKYVNYYFQTDYNINGIPSVVFAIVALSLNDSAYNAVTIKASIQSVDKGQIEAAYSLGMTYWQSLFRIVIPEAIEVAIPSIGNTVIGLVKTTSLAFSCAVIEITAQAKIVASRNFRYFEAYVALAVIYWLLTIILEQIVRFIEKKVSIPDVVSDRSFTEET